MCQLSWNYISEYSAANITNLHIFLHLVTCCYYMSKTLEFMSSSPDWSTSDIKGPCSLRWKAMAESSVRWFIVREKHCSFAETVRLIRQLYLAGGSNKDKGLWVGLFICCLHTHSKIYTCYTFRKSQIAYYHRSVKCNYLLFSIITILHHCIFSFRNQ